MPLELPSKASNERLQHAHYFSRHLKRKMKKHLRVPPLRIPYQRARFHDAVAARTRSKTRCCPFFKMDDDLSERFNNTIAKQWAIEPKKMVEVERLLLRRIKALAGNHWQTPQRQIRLVPAEVEAKALQCKLWAALTSGEPNEIAHAHTKTASEASSSTPTPSGPITPSQWVYATPEQQFDDNETLAISSVSSYQLAVYFEEDYDVGVQALHNEHALRSNRFDESLGVDIDGEMDILCEI